MAERMSIDDLEGTTCIVENYYCLDEASETLSYRHLRFAFESLEGDRIGEKGRADAITWAKRALDARLGLLLSAMGFDSSWPCKINRVCSSIGLEHRPVTPEIAGSSPVTLVRMSVWLSG